MFIFVKFSGVLTIFFSGGGYVFFKNCLFGLLPGFRRVDGHVSCEFSGWV